MSSIAIYQKVNGDEKLRIGFALGLSLLNSNAMLPIQAFPNNPQPIQAIQQFLAIAPAQNVVQMKENVSDSDLLVPFQYEQENPLQDAQVPNFDLMQILSDVQNKDVVAVSQMAKKSEGTEITKQQIVKKTSPRVPLMFSGCTIHENVTINLPE